MEKHKRFQRCCSALYNLKMNLHIVIYKEIKIMSEKVKELQEKLHKLESQKWYHYRLFEDYRKQCWELSDVIEKECVKHDWIKDNSAMDHKTHYICSKCKSCN
jgi:hypothetical protein